MRAEMRLNVESLLFFTVPLIQNIGLSPSKETSPTAASTLVKYCQLSLASWMPDKISTERHSSVNGALSQVKQALAAIVSPGRMNPLPPLIPSKKYNSWSRMDFPAPFSKLARALYDGATGKSYGLRAKTLTRTFPS